MTSRRVSFLFTMVAPCVIGSNAIPPETCWESVAGGSKEGRGRSATTPRTSRRADRYREDAFLGTPPGGAAEQLQDCCHPASFGSGIAVAGIGRWPAAADAHNVTLNTDGSGSIGLLPAVAFS
jgi:hypothetical protein